MARANEPRSESAASVEEKARKLQRGLYIAAKRYGKRRFHALYDRMYQKGVLREAWRRVKYNRGVAGIDGKTIEAVEREGLDGFLREIQERLQEGRYHPKPVRREYIPKPDGRMRPLGIPTVRDRVVQSAAKIVLEPIFEADFCGCSYGFRPKRSATQALERLRKLAPKSYEWALEVDIERYFDNIDHDRLMKLVERRVSDWRMLKLVRKWLKAGMLEAGERRETLVGTPQGGVISPLLANIYLHELDQRWGKTCRETGELVRYADDLVVLCRNETLAKVALEKIRELLGRLGLRLNPDKTRIVHLRREGIDFLGCHLRMGASRKYKERWYLYRWPSKSSMKNVRRRIRAITTPKHAGKVKQDEVLERLNRLLRGWANYFRTGNATKQFYVLDSYVYEMLVRYEHRRRGWNQGTRRGRFGYTWYNNLPLYRLLGTIRYPIKANAG